MKLTIFPDYDSLSKNVAKKVFERVNISLQNEKSFVIGLATGKTPINLYK